MKQVIFICLLSISLCLSNPTGQSVAPSNPPETEKHDAVTATTQASTPPAVVIPSQANVDPANKNAVPKDTTAPPAVAPTQLAPNTPENATEKANSTGDKSTEANPSTKPLTSSPKPETSEAPAPVTTPKPVPDQKPTAKPEPDHKTTVTPKTIEPTPTLQARGFDGASFVGGIILTLGLLAIGFMGFKYYKNQTERNYHTL